MNNQQKLKIFKSYAKAYHNELTVINNMLATGWYTGQVRQTLLNRKRKIHFRIKTYQKYCLSL